MNTQRQMSLQNAILCCVLVATSALATDRNLADSGACNLADCGATGDGTDETSVIQSCIDGCHSRNIVFPKGSFLVGGLTVSGTNVSLHFMEGASLAASQERSAYAASQDDWYMLLLHKCRGCQVTAEGAGPHLDGQAQQWVASINEVSATWW